MAQSKAALETAIRNDILTAMTAFLSEHYCPSCDSRLKVRDSRLRKVIDSSGNTLVFSLPRLFCPQCKKLHILLPDIIKPFKSYSRLVIDNARAGQIMDCPADDSTIRRWRK